LKNEDKAQTLEVTSLIFIKKAGQTERCAKKSCRFAKEDRVYSGSDF
jgi:hypothetical protein